MSGGPYKMGTIARLSGFSPELLRAWERRYGLLTPSRGPGGQRLYDDDDLRVLRRVRELVDDGRAIGEIAPLGRKRLLADSPGLTGRAGGAGRGSGGAGRASGGAGFSPPHAGPAEAGPSSRSRQGTPGSPTDGGPGRTGGAGFSPPHARSAEASPASGSVLWRRRILDAALGMDSAALSATLDEAFATAGPERTVHDVIEVSAREIGDLWAEGTCSVASEHLASDHFTHRVRRMLDEAQPVSNAAPRLVAACFPDEHHQLGLLVLSWHLARRGFRIDYLGTSFPLSNLEQACRAASPQAVLLSVTRKATYRRHRQELAAVLGRRSFRWPVYVGGQAVSDTENDLPRPAHVIDPGTDVHDVLDTIAGSAAVTSR